VISTVSNVCLIDGPLFPSSVNNKCPAIIFAVRRTANVPGRIRFLIVSIITINGISIVGVPWGAKFSNIWLVFLTHPNNINLIHKGSTIRLICEVKSTTYEAHFHVRFSVITQSGPSCSNIQPFFSAHSQRETTTVSNFT